MEEGRTAKSLSSRSAVISIWLTVFTVTVSICGFSRVLATSFREVRVAKSDSDHEEHDAELVLGEFWSTVDPEGEAKPHELDPAKVDPAGTSRVHVQDHKSSFQAWLFR